MTKELPAEPIIVCDEAHIRCNRYSVDITSKGKTSYMTITNQRSTK